MCLTRRQWAVGKEGGVVWGWQSYLWMVVKHMGEFKFRQAAQELDQRLQQRPGKDMVSQILGSGEKSFSLL